jgi:hypothetical protein
MKRPVQRPKPEIFEQLALGLAIDDAIEDGAGISPDEARRRSEVARAALEEFGPSPDAEKPEWLERYFDLRDGGWPWRVACYIAWCASPKNSRWPKTQEELATQVLGLTSDRQIGTWRRKNQSIDEMIALLQAAPLFDHRADIYRALITSASDPDHRSNPDRKLALELMGDYVPRVQVDNRDVTDVEDLSQLSDEELDELSRKAGNAHE